ncbi:uncharacterized protein LOC129319410 isoform X2 [Prosopis cineraria]|uniref:uncharacterized protein LOC129319410 isoform X2 n=1 Tax=Prosopis cineraria TaxID=364024 RepID=UPI00240EF04E|nr:uncharacterized protein LOC129319410 isoform X2 [Prosopis cineraria]
MVWDWGLPKLLCLCISNFEGSEAERGSHACRDGIVFIPSLMLQLLLLRNPISLQASASSNQNTTESATTHDYLWRIPPKTDFAPIPSISVDPFPFSSESCHTEWGHGVIIHLIHLLILQESVTSRENVPKASQVLENSVYILRFHFYLPH